MKLHAAVFSAKVRKPYMVNSRPMSSPAIFNGRRSHLLLKLAYIRS